MMVSRKQCERGLLWFVEDGEVPASGTIMVPGTHVLMALSIRHMANPTH
jgi:hypothetical protein